METNLNEFPKPASKLKVFCVALLGYLLCISVANLIFAIAELINTILDFSIVHFITNRISEYFGIYLGLLTFSWVSMAFMNKAEDIIRTKFTLGVLLVINYVYFIIDVFRYGDNFYFSYILWVLVGIYHIIMYRLPKEGE